MPKKFVPTTILIRGIKVRPKSKPIESFPIESLPIKPTPINNTETIIPWSTELWLGETEIDVDRKAIDKAIKMCPNKPLILVPIIIRNPHKESRRYMLISRVADIDSCRSLRSVIESAMTLPAELKNLRENLPIHSP